MRNHPEIVHRVAAEAAADLVVHAAQRHTIEGEQRHVQGLFVSRTAGAGRRPVAQQALDAGGVRELGGGSEAAVSGVELFLQLLTRHVKRHGGELRAAVCRRLVHGGHEIDQRAVLLLQFVASLAYRNRPPAGTGR